MLTISASEAEASGWNEMGSRAGTCSINRHYRKLSWAQRLTTRETRRGRSLGRGSVGELGVHLAEHIANGGDRVPYIRAAAGGRWTMRRRWCGRAAPFGSVAFVAQALDRKPRL